MLNRRLPVLWYGADYNPEQWPEEIWHEDMSLMRGAALNVATIGIFSWSTIQPRRDTYDFAWLDRVVALLTQSDIHIILATPTAAPPAWLCQAHPDVLPVDVNLVRYSYGSRRHYCPNSPSYRRCARTMAATLAHRYGAHSHLVLWHIDNEYAGHLGACYCDRCARAFRAWLSTQYGDVADLNNAWNTTFWGQTYDDWSEIQPPRTTPSFSNPGHALDYRRFMSDSFLACFLDQKEAIREYSTGIPITTNFMGWFKDLDYWSWAPHLDIISWDAYPPPNAPPSLSAAWHDLMRSIKSRPFLLMEQSPGQVNWMPRNPLPRPGEVRLRSYQALARGADGVCYFQFRQSRGGAEQFHAGIVSHAGDANSRVYREVTQLGDELRHLGPTFLDTNVEAQVAIIFDWNAWWATEHDPMITTDISYTEEILRYYQALWRRNIPVDFVSAQGDLTTYRLVIAPLLRTVSDETAHRLKAFVRDGGTLLTTFGSALTDDHDRARLGGYPGGLRDLFGIWVEEMDLLDEEQTMDARVAMPGRYFMGRVTCLRWCDVIHLEGAAAMATFEQGYYAGQPALTRHAFGSGEAIYVGTVLDNAGIEGLLMELCSTRGIMPVMLVPQGVEIAQRSLRTQSFNFVLNHNEEPVTVHLPEARRDLLRNRWVRGNVELGGRGVLLLAYDDTAPLYDDPPPS